MIRIKRYFPIILLIVFIIFYFQFNWAEQSDRCHDEKRTQKDESLTTSSLKCIADGSRPFKCLKYGNDVYLPFEKFIRKQFDVSGRLVKDGFDQHFEYYTSYAKIRLPDFLKYDPFAIFGHFGSYNVEIRERVRCISAEYGVPMSTQWDTVPYLYPIQIAQYALQHYSRNLSDQMPKVKTIDLISMLEQDHVEKLDERNIKISNSDDGVLMALDDDSNFTILIFSWRPESPRAAFSVAVEDKKSHRIVKLFYKFDEDGRCVWSNNDVDDYNEENRKQDELKFTYTLGKFTNSSWTTIVRDILVDSSKAIALIEPVAMRKDGTQNNIPKTGDIQLLSLKFYGDCTVHTSLKQQTKAHHEIFLRSAEWFIDNQDPSGGWPVPVQREIADNQLVLPAGWYSAMAQGHALSVLTRAFHATHNSRFIESGQKALKLFQIPASKGGVKNSLFGYVWYEEYPTTPGTFVLNGFLYSLIGLYDFAAIAPNKNETLQLFNAGLESLRQFLPLYDTGSGSIYDLRHMSLKSVPNLARWDYHAVHVYLLKWLYIITKDESLNKVADRWAGYAQGKKAKHN